MLIEVSTALLRLPEGEIVFQRRKADHWLNPAMLGLFGGHLEPEDNLDPQIALQRELEEETSLDIGKLSTKRCISIFIPARYTTVDLWYHMHEIDIADAHFEVYDGPGAEIYPAIGILQRQDLEPAIKFALKTMEIQ